MVLEPYSAVQMHLRCTWPDIRRAGCLARGGGPDGPALRPAGRPHAGRLGSQAAGQFCRLPRSPASRPEHGLHLAGPDVGAAGRRSAQAGICSCLAALRGGQWR